MIDKQSKQNSVAITHFGRAVVPDVRKRRHVSCSGFSRGTEETKSLTCSVVN